MHYFALMTRHCHRSTPTRADHNIWMMLVEFHLGNANGFLEIIVGQGRIHNRVTVVLEIGRLDAARCRVPAVEVEDCHGALYPNFLA